MNHNKKVSSIRFKLIKYIWVFIIPFILLFSFTILRMYGYYQQYDLLVRNITGVNEYSMDFKDKLDETMYRIIIGSANWTNSEEKLEGDDPDALIKDAKEHFIALRERATEQNVISDLDALIKLFDILSQRVDDILRNVEEGGHYDENMEMLDMNIRVLTSLIQTDIQQYIYDEGTNMEMLRKEVAGSLLSTLRILILLLVASVVIIYFLSRRMAERITTPITELVETTQRFAGGDFTVEYHTGSNDEMEILAESFNRMVKEMKTLIEDIHREQENAKDAELRLLQEQINPHFLYNTLDAIVWMTEAGENKKAIRMVQELSNFFRISLSKGKNEITIENERRHIGSYLEIQRYRYQDILDYEIVFDEEISGYLILKLTLQPIVENALYHGIKNKRGKGMIKVWGFKEGGDIVFTVEDNGRGMKPEELKNLQGLISGEIIRADEGGYGMANVEKRLEMLYGENYGITVESNFGVGTTVTVRIPAVRGDSEDEE